MCDLENFKNEEAKTRKWVVKASRRRRRRFTKYSGTSASKMAGKAEIACGQKYLLKSLNGPFIYPGMRMLHTTRTVHVKYCIVLFLVTETRQAMYA